MLRGLFPPRSSIDEKKESAAAMAFGDLFLVGLVLGPMITSTLVCFLLGVRGVGPAMILVFILLMSGQMLVIFAIGQSRDSSPLRPRLEALALGPIGADGSVAAIEGEVAEGPEGAFEAPISKTPCVWSIVDLEITAKAGSSKTTRKERIERASTFRVDLADGTTALVDPTDGDMFFGFGAGDPPEEPERRAFALANGIELRDEESVWLRERRVPPATRVFVVGIVRRGADGPAYRGGDIPTIMSDATTGVTVSELDRARLLAIMKPSSGRPFFLAGGTCLALAALVAFLAAR